MLRELWRTLTPGSVEPPARSSQRIGGSELLKAWSGAHRRALSTYGGGRTMDDLENLKR